MDELDNVLILCTRNSARRQMAEGLLKAKVGDRFNDYSAGLKPDRVYPMVPVVMDEAGIDVSEQYATIQYRDEHGAACTTQRSAVVRPIRAGNHRRTHP